jgi:erythrin-vacuolar iron transport family protein
MAMVLEETAALAEARKDIVLRYVQPGLAGLIDGSVSTLAPIFAAAFATGHNGATFLVGLAASIGAGISMGFTEALSDDGSVCGVMTAIGGLGHTLPYAIPDTLPAGWPNAFVLATSLAVVVVLIELAVIAGIRTRFMATPFWRAALQVMLGGVLVLVTGILIGSA